MLGQFRSGFFCCFFFFQICYTKHVPLEGKFKKVPGQGRVYLHGVFKENLSAYLFSLYLTYVSSSLHFGKFTGSIKYIVKLI